MTRIQLSPSTVGVAVLGTIVGVALMLAPFVLAARPAEIPWRLMSPVVGVHACAEVASVSVSCATLELADGSKEVVEIRVIPELFGSGEAAGFATTARGFGHICAVGVADGPCRVVWAAGLGILNEESTEGSLLADEINRIGRIP